MHRHLAAHKEALLEATARVLDSGVLVQGPELLHFEQDWTHIAGVDYAIGVGNGYDALYLAAITLGAAPGHKVWLPAFTCPATLMAMLKTGAEVCLYDVDATTGLADVELLLSLLEDVKAGKLPTPSLIVVVDIFGQQGQWQVLLKALADFPDTQLLIDGAQSHGLATVHIPGMEHRVLTATSFYPTKNLGALGEAGAILTSHKPWHDKLKTLRDYGAERKFYSTEPTGGNYRLDELQAACLNTLLPHLEHWTTIRQTYYSQYYDALAEHPYLTLTKAKRPYNGHLITVRCQQRDALVSHLQAHGVGYMVHYPYAMHHMPVGQQLAQLTTLSHAEAWAAEVLSLPGTPYHTEDEIAQVIAVLQSFRP